MNTPQFIFAFIVGAISGGVWTYMFISANSCVRLQKRLVTILGQKGEYVEAGDGGPNL